MAATGRPNSQSLRLHGLNTGTRLAISAVLGVAAALATVFLGSSRYAPAIGWDAAVITLLAWTWFTIWPQGADNTAEHATREDPTRALSDVLLLSAAVVSLAAVAFLLSQGGSAKGTAQDLVAGVGVATVALSWFVIHTVFVLRYAMLFYSGHEGGVNFNQASAPRYTDFAYLAFTIGMTFQVSDTDLRTPAFRATALRHALLSYLFGAVIVATTINLVAGFGSGG
ncbi:MAG: hypothetical protein QOK10_1712 [Pseudonocardiales bacterium]|jgi:uncharacterized membrane protein|nr:hypothetical protein [Pseudonocardiales bacterium]